MGTDTHRTIWPLAPSLSAGRGTVSPFWLFGRGQQSPEALGCWGELGAASACCSSPAARGRSALPAPTVEGRRWERDSLRAVPYGRLAAPGLAPPRSCPMGPVSCGIPPQPRRAAGTQPSLGASETLGLQVGPVGATGPWMG